jgi:hypothetical protein
MLLSGAAAAAMTSATHAALVVDVLATGATGAGNVVVNSKSVTVLAPGTVTFDIFGKVVNPFANGNVDDGNSLNEAITNVFGNYLSSGTGVSGTLSGTVSGSFQGSGWSTGALSDLDGDGDLDIGSNNSSLGDNFWAARSPVATGVVGNSILIGTLTLTVTSVNDPLASTLINYQAKPGTPSGVGLWRENGSFIQSNSAGNIGPGVPVTLNGIPEPTSLGLIGLTGLGLLARRRK